MDGYRKEKARSDQGVTGSRPRTAIPGTHRGPLEGLDKLKRDIAINQYDVDASAVADAILKKIALIKRGRRALAESAAESAVDRSRPLEAKNRLDV